MQRVLRGPSQWVVNLFWGCLLLAVTGGAEVVSDFPEIDLVFPLNETYSPSPLFPIVFAIQNYGLAKYTQPSLELEVWNYNNWSIMPDRATWDLREWNVTDTGVFFLTKSSKVFNIETNWLLKWRLRWTRCNATSLKDGYSKYFYSNYSPEGIFLTTAKNSSLQVDLAAAINNDKTCANSTGITINITETFPVPSYAKDKWDGGDTCADVVLPTPAPDPCRVKMNDTIASSISSSMTSQECAIATALQSSAVVSCPPQETESSAQQLVSWTMASFVVALFGLDYIVN